MGLRELAMCGACMRQLLRELANCRLDQRYYRRLEGTMETLGDQRNILMSVTNRYHELKRGWFFVRKKILSVHVILPFVSDGMPYTGDN